MNCEACVHYKRSIKECDIEMPWDCEYENRPTVDYSNWAELINLEDNKK